jgi:hypothetical protein
LTVVSHAIGHAAGTWSPPGYEPRDQHLVCHVKSQGRPRISNDAAVTSDIRALRLACRGATRHRPCYKDALIAPGHDVRNILPAPSACRACSALIAVLLSFSALR